MNQSSLTKIIEKKALIEGVHANGKEESEDHTNARELDIESSQFEKMQSRGIMGFCEFDLETRACFCSASFLEMTGYSSRDVADIDFFLKCLVHGDDQRKARKYWKKCLLEKDRDSIFDFRLRKADQSYIWVSAGLLPIFDQDKLCRKVVLTVSNIDEITGGQKALRDAEQRYRNLFDKILYGIIKADLKTAAIVDYNRKAAEFLGNFGDLTFDDFMSLFFENEREGVLNELLEKRNLSNRECRIKLPDNEEKWFLASAELADSEAVAEFYFNDITETKKNILELQKINFELDNFVYHSSHDLKSPLKSILGLINILKMEKDLVFQQDCINMIEGSILRLDKLVNDLLSLSRNSRINDDHSSINFMVELNNTVTNFYHTADTKNLQIRPFVFQPCPFIADLTRVRIILNNLISNAIKYRNHNRRPSYVQIEVNVSQEKAVLRIEDNGIGIPKSKVDKVFDMFYRASENSDGSGLGLYIVKNVLDKINGTISLESKENEGTVFTIEIPNNLNR